MSGKRNQAKKLSTRNLPQEPKASWRNNFLKLRPDDAPVTAKCRQCGKGDNVGRFYWSCKETDYFRWDDDIPEDERVGTSATVTVSTNDPDQVTPPPTPTSTTPPPVKPKSGPRSGVTTISDDEEKTEEFIPGLKALTGKLFGLTKRLERAEAAVEATNMTMTSLDDSMTSVVERLILSNSDIKKRMDEMERDRTKLLLRISDLEETVRKANKSSSSVSPSPSSDTNVPSTSAFFQETLKKSRELHRQVQERMDKEKKDGEKLSKWLASQHKKQSQASLDSEWIETNPEATSKIKVIDVTDEKEDSVDLLEEALIEYAKTVNVSTTDKPFVEKKREDKDARSPTEKQ